MSGIALIASVLYLFGQTLSVPRNCTLNDLCLPVRADVCDNSKCLQVNQSEIDEFASFGLKLYKWNTVLSAIASSCSFKYYYETSVAYDGTVTTYRVYNLTTGPSCDECSSKKLVIEPYNAPGNFTVNKRTMCNAPFEQCYLYYEPGVAIVFRNCLMDPSYQYGQACAGIYASVNPDVYSETGELDKFLEGLGIDLPKTVNDCN